MALILSRGGSPAGDPTSFRTDRRPNFSTISAWASLETVKSRKRRGAGGWGGVGGGGGAAGGTPGPPPPGAEATPPPPPPASQAAPSPVRAPRAALPAAPPRPPAPRAAPRGAPPPPPPPFGAPPAPRHDRRDLDGCMLLLERRHHGVHHVGVRRRVHDDLALGLALGGRHARRP